VKYHVNVFGAPRTRRLVDIFYTVSIGVTSLISTGIFFRASFILLEEYVRFLDQNLFLINFGDEFKCRSTFSRKNVFFIKISGNSREIPRECLRELRA